MAVIKVGGKVQWDGEAMRVVEHEGFDAVVLQAADGRLRTVALDDLAEPAPEKQRTAPQADAIRLAKVERYKAVLGPLIGKAPRTKADVAAAADELGTSVSSVYRALERQDASGDMNDLPPPTRPGGRDKSRINPAAEKIISDTIKRILLNRRQHRKAFFMKEVKKALAKRSFTVSDDTLRKRVEAIPPETWIKTREGYKSAKKKLSPIISAAPTGEAPLDIVQADHWKTDVEILSDDRLSSIGRAWLTLAIDLYTRVIWGWHLGLDSPGTVPMAFCMINGLTRKDKAIKALGLTARMPFWGKPKVLHLDNAGEFRGKAVAAGCAHNHITLKFRPVESPQYGGHIERLNGTLALKFKDLPGATGSSVAERKALRPQVTSALTFDDLAKQLVLMFDEYHNERHAGIGNVTPLEKWTSHFFHPDGRAKRTLPPVPVDDLELRLHWYPTAKCTIQAYGIRIHFLDYYNEEIEQLYRSGVKYGQLEAKRNPLDVREVYILHPIRSEWIAVPCRQIEFPVATIKELQDARKEAKRLGRAATSENLAAIIDERQQHLEEAEKKTKSAARQATIAANNRKLRAAAPKSFEDAAVGSEAEESGSADDAPSNGAAPIRTSKSNASGPARRPDTGGARNDDAFEGAAAEIAKISDDEIDKYLDGR